MLQGVKNFLVNGIMLGEFDSSTSVSELMSKVEELMADKNKNYQARLNNIKENGTEDDVFR